MLITHPHLPILISLHSAHVYAPSHLRHQVLGLGSARGRSRRSTYSKENDTREPLAPSWCSWIYPMSVDQYAARSSIRRGSRKFRGGEVGWLEATNSNDNSEKYFSCIGLWIEVALNSVQYGDDITAQRGKMKYLLITLTLSYSPQAEVYSPLFPARKSRHSPSWLHSYFRRRPIIMPRWNTWVDLLVQPLRQMASFPRLRLTSDLWPHFHLAWQTQPISTRFHIVQYVCV